MRSKIKKSNNEKSPIVGGVITRDLKVWNPTGTILLADDDYQVQSMLVDFLESVGFNVIVANNGNEAVTQFANNKEKIVMCILDCIMPEMTGEEAFGLLRAIDEDVPVIMISGVNYTSSCMMSHNFGYIKKPLTLNNLLRMMRNILHGSHHETY